MFFAPVRSVYRPSLRAMDRLFNSALQDAAASTQQTQVAQDDKAYTLSFDVPGIAKEQLSIGIEANVVRIESLPEAPRQYSAAYELPVDIDVAHSEAKLENGVLTLKLAKLAPQSQVTRLTIN